MIYTTTVMSVSHFHDFYYLAALRAALADKTLAFSRAAEKLREDTEALWEDLVPNIALRTFIYLWSATLGEARNACEQAKDMFVVQLRGGHREEAYSQVTYFPPDRHNFDVLEAVFSQPWRASFGGKAWLQIVKAMRMYGTVPDAAFIDHVVDIEHNNGTVFSKLEALPCIFFDVTYHGSLHNFLDYKFSCDILRDPFRLIPVSGKVHRLLSRFCTIAQIPQQDWIIAGLDNLTEYVVQWGEGKLATAHKWAPWANTVAHNHPQSASEAFAALDFSPAKQAETRREILGMLPGYMEKAAAMRLPPSKAPRLKKQVKQYLNFIASMKQNKEVD